MERALELWNWISRHRGQQAPLAEELARHVPWNLDRLGEQEFGMVEIPTVELLPRIMQGFQLAEFQGDWQTYHRWYIRSGATPDHDITRPILPVWLAIDHCDNEALEDGWHRLHDYVRKGVRTIPCVYTPFHPVVESMPISAMNVQSMVPV